MARTDISPRPRAAVRPRGLVTLLTLLLGVALLLVSPSRASASVIGPGTGERMGSAAPGATPAPDPTDLLNAGTPGEAGGTETAQERIRDYDVKYELQPDGTLLGTDTIAYSFPAGQDRRGIFVYWPVRIQQDADHYRLYPIEVTGVSSPTGAPTTYETSDDGQVYTVRIGDKDEYVEGTEQTYVITYEVKGTVNGFPDHQELYVNPIGFRSQVPIERARVTVTAPQAAQDVGCSAGAYGTRAPERCEASSSGTTATFTATGLAPGEGLTIAGRYPAGTVSNAEPIIRTGDAQDGGGLGEVLPQPVSTALSIGGYAGGALIPALVALVMGLLVARRGRDERYAGLTPGLAPADGAEGTVVRGSAGPVAVRFTPPDGGTPGLIGTLIDESADTKDVSATVVDLAVRGYLTIEEVDTGRRSKADWRLVRAQDPPAGELLPYQRTVLNGLFRRGDDVRLSELKNHFSSTLALAKKDMYREVVDRGWFRQSPEAIRHLWMGWAFAIAVVGAVVLFFAGLASVSIDNASGIGVAIPSGVVLGVGILVAAVVVFVLGQRMPARTARGSAIQAQALGYRQYLETAEAHQIRFEEAQSIFSRGLPYAIVFGCAERWAEVFHDVAEAAHAQGYALDMPSWYLFYGLHAGSFDFGSIASSMDDFSTVAAGTFAATPGSSGQSAFGGSGGSFGGGGGFSGGGGFGGGGVGSW